MFVIRFDYNMFQFADNFRRFSSDEDVVSAFEHRVYRWLHKESTLDLGV
jgi:hypothetical protein